MVGLPNHAFIWFLCRLLSFYVLFVAVAAVKAHQEEEEAIELTPVLFKKAQKLKLLERMHAKRDDAMFQLLQKMVDNQTKVQQLLYQQHPSGAWVHHPYILDLAIVLTLSTTITLSYHFHL